MAAYAIAGRRDGHGIDLDLSRMIMCVGVKVCGMTLGAGASGAAIDCGVTMTSGARDAGAIFWRMTESTGVFVHSGDDVAGVAIDAERGAGHRGGMIVCMAAEVSCMTTCTLTTCNGCDKIFARGFSQGRGGGVTLGTGVLVYAHRVVGRVAKRNTGRCICDMAQSAGASGGVIY